ncbi:MAG: hypothetical protein AB8B93_06035 [Pseudomonadales bacterium]
MSRPKIVEANYYEFQDRLTKATNAGKRLEKADQPAWDEYVSSNKVNEIAMRSWGSSKYEDIVPVIIADGSTWDGYYVYSKTDEACLKWTIPED